MEWLDKAKKIESPNFDHRPESAAVDLLVIHSISLPPGEYQGNYVEDFFQNNLDITAHSYFEGIAELRVSSHLYIRRDGKLVQFVPLDKRAWHAGESSWKGRTACNDFSIGIELEGTDTDAFTEEQYMCLQKVTLEIMELYPQISMDRIVGHSDIAPGRKTDPGSGFDWQRYKRSLEKK